MEKFAILLFPALCALLLFRLLLMPMKAAWRLAIHSAGGLACLWLLNTVSGFTGICFPINAATVLLSGFGGLPGVGLLALLEVM